MIGGSSNLTQLRVIEETTFGAVPGAGNPNNIRNTGDTLAFSITNKESEEIVADRMTTDLIQVGAAANGAVNFELSYKEFDTYLRAALCSAGWTYYGLATPGVGQGVGTSFGGTFSASVITADVAPTTTSGFVANVGKGQWFQVQAAGSANDKKWFKTHSVTASTATTITVDPMTPMAVDAVSKPTKISFARLSNGVAQTSFTLEREHTDITQLFPFYGMTLSNMSLSIASGDIIKGSIEFMGKNGGRVTVTVMPGAPVTSQTFDVMNAVVGVGTIYEGGVVLSDKIKKIDIKIENMLRGQDAIGNLGNAGIGYGSFKVSGSMSVYLANGNLYDKFVNNITSSLQIPLMDTAKNGYMIQLPKLKYGDAKVTSGNKDTDCMIEVPFTGLKDQTVGALNKSLIIDRMGV